jgi:hypothetical protein
MPNPNISHISHGSSASKFFTDFKKLSFFKDQNGRVVLFQWPNVPLGSWLVLKLLSAVTSSQPLKMDINLLSMAVLLIWAYQEITTGVNYFRRLLGLVVFGAITIGFLTVK